MVEQGWLSGRAGVAQWYSRDGSVVEQGWPSGRAGIAQ